MHLAKCKSYISLVSQALLSWLGVRHEDVIDEQRPHL